MSINKVKKPEFKGKKMGGKNISSKSKTKKIKAELKEMSTEQLDEMRREWQKGTIKNSEAATNGQLTWYVLEKLEKVTRSKTGQIRNLFYQTSDDLGQARFNNEEEFSKILRRLNNSFHKTNGLVGIYWADDGTMYVDKIMIFYKDTVFNKDERSLQITSAGNFRVFGFLKELEGHRNTVVTVIHRNKSRWALLAKRAAGIMKISNNNLVAEVLHDRRGYCTPQEERISSLKKAA